MFCEIQYRNFLSGCLVGTIRLVEKPFCLYSNPSCFKKPATSNRHTVVFPFDDLQDPACCRIFANSICAQDKQTPIGVHAELIHCTPRAQNTMLMHFARQQQCKPYCYLLCNTLFNYTVYVLACTSHSNRQDWQPPLIPDKS